MTNSIKNKIKQTRRFARSFFLCRFLLARDFHYEHNPKLIDVGWKKVQSYGAFRCPIRFLRASIGTNKGKTLVKIEQTPHYRYVQGLVGGNIDSSTREVLSHYIKTFLPESIPEEVLEKTANLVKSMVQDPDFASKVSIVTYPPKRIRGTSAYEVRIYDGVHRACIANAMGYKYIRCRMK